MRYLLLAAAVVAYFIYRNQSPYNFILIAIVAVLFVSALSSKKRTK